MADGARMGQLAQEGFDQGGFAGAVLADEHRELAAVNVHGNILQERLAAAPDGDPIQVDMAQVALVKHETVSLSFTRIWFMIILDGVSISQMADPPLRYG